VIPLKKHLVGYNSNTFLQDAVAGLVVGMVTIPQAIAYALLAGVPAQAGLYACLLPMILYALLGSSKHLVVGPVAIAAVMIVSTVSEFAPKYSAEYLSITQAICIEVSVIFVILRLARLGSLANLVSHPVLTGFVNGAVLLIIISQIPALIGTDNSSSLSAIDLLQILTAQDNQFDWISLFLGLAAISFLIVYRWVLTKEDENPRQNKSFGAPLLVGLGPAILISSAIFFVYYLGDLKSLSTVGQIPQGLPTFLLPEIDSQLWISIFPSSFIIALVIYVESFSIATTLASREKMTIDAQQELIALSAANFGAGMTGGSAFIYSDQKNLIEMMNKENIDTYQVIDEGWKNFLLKILVDFNKQTKSKRAAYIIENFDQELSKFVHVVPDEVIDKLNFPVTEKYKIA